MCYFKCIRQEDPPQICFYQVLFGLKKNIILKILIKKYFYPRKLFFPQGARNYLLLTSDSAALYSD